MQLAEQEPLYLYEEVLLLALKDKEGTIARGTLYQFAIGGAVMAELLLQGKVAGSGSGRKERLHVKDAAPTGDSLLDDCLHMIAAAKRARRLSDWVLKIAQLSRLKQRAARGLCERGILSEAEESVLFVFNRTVYPEQNPEPERLLLSRLRTAIFSDTLKLDPRTAVLVALAQSADVLKVVFDKKDLKARKDRIRRIIEGGVIGSATHEAIHAMQVAIMVAVSIPATIAAASAASS